MFGWFKMLMQEPEPCRSENRIVAACDPWTLACAIGAVNGTNGMAANFDSWFRLSQSNWVPEIQTKTGASVGEIKSAVHHFAKQNRGLCLINAVREICVARGLPQAPVLAPSESFTIRLSDGK